MASEGSTQAIIKRRQDELALMPPPPIKRIKRPTEVLDEDDYTDALSDIISRDFFPGVKEFKTQEEYLEAYQSKNPVWIREAEAKLRAATSGQSSNYQGQEGETTASSGRTRTYVPVGQTPLGPTGSETPISTTSESIADEESAPKSLDTSQLSLSDYQAKYTSEDNASFNTVLDKQNEKRRQKHAYLWTSDQRLLSQAQIKQRNQKQNLLKEKAEYESTNSKELIPLTTGATSDRSAKPAAWKSKTPNNSLMFIPSTSVDEEGLQTIQELKESMSKAGPKQIVYENTRFPRSGPSYGADDDDDDATSIHTSFIARRNAAGTDAGTLSGAETPRVNGYSFVDEDQEPPPRRQADEPTYRDLLAGQTADDTPNPFQLKENRRREDLHYKLVERDAEKSRSKLKERDSSHRNLGNMTPAGRKLMERLSGRTSLPDASSKQTQRREDWTPAATPRRNRAVAK